MTSKTDTLLEMLGTGKWNAITIFLVGYWEMVVPSNSLGGAYLTPKVGHSCIIPSDGEPIIKEDGDNETSIDACWYRRNSSDGVEILPCTEWEFDNSTFLTTLTSEFQLVCEREYLRPTYSSIYFFGALIASPICGFLSDRYGRKTVLSVGMIVYSIISNCICWLPNLSSILAARFMLGLMYPTSASVVYALVMEECQPKHRAAVGILCILPWILGYCTFAGQGYLIREWRRLMVVLPIPALLVLILLWFVDESPRWLILKGYHDRALKVFHRAARLNKSTLPSDQELRLIMKEIQVEGIKEEDGEHEKSGRFHEAVRSVKNDVLELFGTRVMRRVTLSIYSIFMVSGMVYYGLSLSGGNLGSDPYIFMVLSGVMEIPGNTITLPMVNKIGRKVTDIIFFSTTAISLLLVTFIPKGTVATAMSLIGKMSISAAYQIVYLHATELYPTQVRVRGLGTSSMVSKVGTIFAPYIVDGLGSLYWWAPSVVCGLAAVGACLVCFLLPETMGMALPDTVAELEETLIHRRRKVSKPGKKETELATINAEE